MATLITYSPGTTIKSADMNTNLSALNTAVNSVQQSGETAGNRLVWAQPTGYGSPSIDIEDDGTVHARVNDNSTLSDFISLVPGGAGNAAMTIGNSGLASSRTNYWGLLQMIRNGTKQGNQIFTGTSSPSGQATGDVWIKA